MAEEVANPDRVRLPEGYRVMHISDLWSAIEKLEARVWSLENRLRELEYNP